MIQDINIIIDPEGGNYNWNLEVDYKTYGSYAEATRIDPADYPELEILSIDVVNNLGHRHGINLATKKHEKLFDEIHEKCWRAAIQKQGEYYD